MKQMLVLLMILLLGSKSSYSQEIFPRILVIGNDTVIVLQPEQVKQINIVYEFNRALKEENTVLGTTLDKYVLLNSQKDMLFLQKQVTEKELRDRAIELGDMLKISEEHNNKLKRNRKLWFISGVGVGLLTVLIIN